MKEILLEFYKGVGINRIMTENLEAIIFSAFILIMAFAFWMVSKHIFRLIFSKISKKTKSKFDDYLIKNKIYTELKKN